MAQFTIGVDLGGTNLRIAAVDDSGRILETINTATEVARGRDAVVSEMCEAIRSLALKHHNAGSLQGIGIGVPGIIDMKSGMIRQSPNLPDWQNYPVKEEIERQLSTNVFLENDANSAALGEKWLGAGKDRRPPLHGRRRTSQRCRDLASAQRLLRPGQAVRVSWPPGYRPCLIA